MDSRVAKSFEDLVVWQKAHQFVLSVYRYSDYFPQKEIYGLTLQLRRTAIAIAANIVEGFQRRHSGDAAHLINEAQGSLEKCRYYLALAKDLGYGDHPELLPQLEEVGALLEKHAAAMLAPDS